MKIQDLEKEEKVRWRSKKKYPCKKLKGFHQFEIVKDRIFETLNIIRGKGGKEKEELKKIRMIEMRCVACGKKEIEFKEK
jgi:hypothetical protein